MHALGKSKPFHCVGKRKSEEKCSKWLGVFRFHVYRTDVHNVRFKVIYHIVHRAYTQELLNKLRILVLRLTVARFPKRRLRQAPSNNIREYALRRILAAKTQYYSPFLLRYSLSAANSIEIFDLYAFQPGATIRILWIEQTNHAKANA